MGWALAECHSRVPVHWGALSHYSSSPPIALRLDAPPTGTRGMPPQLVLLASLFAVHPQYQHLQNPGSSPYSSVFIRFSSHPFYSHPQVFTFSVMFISKTWSILINYSHILYTCKRMFICLSQDTVISSNLSLVGLIHISSWATPKQCGVNLCSCMSVYLQLTWICMCHEASNYVHIEPVIHSSERL